MTYVFMTRMLFLAHITENRYSVRISGRNHKRDDIKIENDSSHSNDEVEVRTRQTNQSVSKRIMDNYHIIVLCTLVLTFFS